MCECVCGGGEGGGGLFDFGISSHSAGSRRKGRDAVSPEREREPSQRAAVPDANYRCHPSALSVQ